MNNDSNECIGNGFLWLIILSLLLTILLVTITERVTILSLQDENSNLRGEIAALKVDGRQQASGFEMVFKVLNKECNNGN